MALKVTTPSPRDPECRDCGTTRVRRRPYIRGNTHFLFIDRNNLQIADLLSDFLHEEGLNRRGNK